MKNFQFKMQKPSNYPFFDTDFIPFLEFSEKKVGIIKLNIAKSSDDEIERLKNASTIILPYTITKEEVRTLINIVSHIIVFFEGSKKDMMKEIHKQVNEVLGRYEIDYEQIKENPVYKMSELPDSVWIDFITEDYNNPLLADCVTFKDLPVLLDKAIQKDYKAGKLYMLSPYDSYHDFAQDFLKILLSKILKNEKKAEQYLNSSNNDILENSYCSFPLLVEKINILKDDIQEYENLNMSQ